MTSLVVNGAVIACSMGTTPSALTVTPIPPAPKGTGMQVAVVSDAVPGTNIASFGMCMSMANPAVQAATTAAQGVFTPAPCVPATSPPWTPGSLAVKVAGVPALPQNAVCNCAWLGVVSVASPGQLPVSVV